MITRVIPPIVFFIALLFNACDTPRSGETKNTDSTVDSTLNNKGSASTIRSQKDTLNSKSFKKDLEDTSMTNITHDSAVDSVMADTVSIEHFAQVSNELHALGINQKEIPTVQEIGIKPYPNAYVVKLGTPFNYKGKSYNTMELVSADSVDVVLSFYNKWKENWYYVENSGVHTFKMDEEKYFRETNNLQIQPFDLMRHPGIDTLFEFEPKSFIFIYYEMQNVQ